jgi:hypothetical protein
MIDARGLFSSGFSAAFVLSLLVACGSGGSGGGGATDTSSFASQYCEIFSQCCGKKGYPADGSTCRNFLSQSASGRTYDPVAGDACISELRAASSKPDFCDTGSSPASCSGVYQSAGGGAQPGATCKQDSDCASSPEGKVDCASHYSNGSETRVCQVQIKGKENDTPCLGTRDGNLTSFSSSGSNDAPPPSRGFICDVADNLYCDGQTKKCTRIQDVGGPGTTGGTYACVKSAYCDFTTKTCVARLPAGADCSSGGSNVCQDKLYCDTATKKCTQGVANGAPCQRSDQCESRSCVNGKCEQGGSLGDLGYVLLCGPKTGG